MQAVTLQHMPPLNADKDPGVVGGGSLVLMGMAGASSLADVWFYFLRGLWLRG